MVDILIRPDWRKWSLRKKIDYLKGSHGGFNLTRQDIAALPDESRGVHYEMRVVRMAVDVIDELTDKTLRKINNEILEDRIHNIFKFYAQHYEGLSPDIMNKFELKFCMAVELIHELTEKVDKLTEKLRYARLDVESVPNNFDN